MAACFARPRCAAALCCLGSCKLRRAEDSYQGLTYLRNLFIDPQDSQDWGTVGLYMGFFCPAGPWRCRRPLWVKALSCGVPERSSFDINPNIFSSESMEKICMSSPKIINLESKPQHRKPRLAAQPAKRGAATDPGSSVDQFTELKAGFAFNKCDSGLNFM